MRRHPHLVLVAYLLPLLPALGVALLARSVVAATLDFSPFAANVLRGNWFGVWIDLSSSSAGSQLGTVLASSLGLAAVALLAMQVLLASGIVEVLLEREPRPAHPFAAGMVLHAWSFARCAVWLLIGAGCALLAAAGVLAGFGSLAERSSDGRLDLVGGVLAAAVFGLLLGVLSPACDLARLAAARHGEGSTLRGFVRGVWLVLRRAGTFMPLEASFFGMAAVLHLGLLALAGAWTPASAPAIAALLVLQQLAMGARAALQVAKWGALAAGYRALEEPRLCRPRLARGPAVEPGVETEPDTPPAPGSESVAPGGGDGGARREGVGGEAGLQGA